MTATTYPINHKNKQYECSQDEGKVAVFHDNGVLVGHIPKLTIPDFEDEPRISMFEGAVKSWLNYLM